MEWRRGINEERVIDRPRWSFDVLVTARYVFVWISPAKLRAKHWNIPVSSGSSPFICRLPPTRTLYRGVFTGLMGTASLYHTISGWGTPAGGSEEECYLTHPHTQRTHCTHARAPSHRLTAGLAWDVYHLLHLSRYVSVGFLYKLRMFCTEFSWVIEPETFLNQERWNVQTRPTESIHMYCRCRSHFSPLVKSDVTHHRFQVQALYQMPKTK